MYSLFEYTKVNDRHQSYKLQYILSFNGDGTGGSVTDHIVTVMKKKIPETISTTNVDVNCNSQ